MPPRLAAVVDERGGKYTSAVQFLSPCKHWELDDCSVERRIHSVAVTLNLTEMCELTGASWEVLSDFEMPQNDFHFHNQPLSTLTLPSLLL